MSKETKRFTEVEERLINVIENFFLWYNGDSNYEIAEEYLDNEKSQSSELSSGESDLDVDALMNKLNPSSKKVQVEVKKEVKPQSNCTPSTTST